jgi:poly-beta-1,6-N-acetyl-D-glucosamine synthase
MRVLFVNPPLTVIFYVCIFLIAYNYLIYPLIIIIAAKIKPRKYQIHLEDQDLPSICLVIPAISDFDTLKRKIENTLRLYYPDNKLMILTVSNKNDLKAQDFLSKYKKQGVVNFKKSNLDNYSEALNIGAKLAKADVIVFSDVHNDFNDIVLVKLARHFKDPKVGAVTGMRSTYESKAKQSSEGDRLYWEYEGGIKHAQSRLGSVTAAASEILAIRRELYKPVPADTINIDSAITFDLVKAGYRVLADKNAVSIKYASKDLKDLFKEQTLKAKGGFQTLFREFIFLFPPRSWFAFNFLSHKAIRWLIPFMLIMLLAISIIQIENDLMKLFLILQIVFYGLSWFGWHFRKRFQLPVISNISTYFVVMNVAVLVGFFRFVFRR